ncbi:hypothetical protein K1T71_010581 [Dendrolimus kikuchii]|uniref:Uncharacterized protein n=1 Tax=Dendrolimus kikuchii TaxID=765133 RepID=A0ACC1CPE6_9NEOP|nr:hypothetical protein K1T71_010581 [Dendrolimus kikuchii]
MEMKNRSVYEDNLESSTPFEQPFNTVNSEDPEKIPISKNIEHCTPTSQKMYLWNQVYWVGNSVYLAAFIGGLLGGPLITYVGRKYSLIGVGVPFFISWIIVASVSNLHLLIAGRVLSGICVGLVYSAFPVYIVETVDPKLRGALGLLPIAFGNGGTLLTHLAGAYLDVSTMAYIAAAVSVPIFLLMFVPPESPRWYIAKGRIHDARKALQWLRGNNYNIENEMEALTHFQIEADKTKGVALKQIFYMENTPAILISFGLMIFQQLTGPNVVFYYAQRLSMTPITASDIQSLYIRIGIASVFSIIIAIILVDLIGRKILLYISSASVILSTSTLSVLAYILESNYNISFGALSQLCLVLYIFGTSVGYESITWLMLAEILPLKIRGTVVPLITGITWLCTIYMGTSFSNMIGSDVPYGSLFFFAVTHLIAIFFIIFCVPETRGKSLEEIEINLTQRVKSVNNGNGADRNTDANL